MARSCVVPNFPVDIDSFSYAFFFGLKRAVLFSQKTILDFENEIPLYFALPRFFDR